MDKKYTLYLYFHRCDSVQSIGTDSHCCIQTLLEPQFSCTDIYLFGIGRYLILVEMGF